MPGQNSVAEYYVGSVQAIAETGWKLGLEIWRTFGRL